MVELLRRSYTAKFCLYCFKLQIWKQLMHSCQLPFKNITYHYCGQSVLVVLVCHLAGVLKVMLFFFSLLLVTDGVDVLVNFLYSPGLKHLHPQFHIFCLAASGQGSAGSGVVDPQIVKLASFSPERGSFGLLNKLFLS